MRTTGFFGMLLENYTAVHSNFYLDRIHVGKICLYNIALTEFGCFGVCLAYGK